MDTMFDTGGSVGTIKGKDAEALVAMSMEVAHGLTGESRYRRAAIQSSDRILKRMRATPFGVLAIKEKEKGKEKFIGGGPPALGWYAACLGYVYRQSGGRGEDLKYLAGVLDKFPWNPDGYWANTINVSTGESKEIDRPTPMNKNAGMAMACAALSEYVRPLDEPLANRLREKTKKCLHAQIFKAQQPDGYWYYGLTERDPKNKDVLGYFMLGASLLVRLRTMAPSFRDPELDRSIAKALDFAVKEIAPMTSPFHGPASRRAVGATPVHFDAAKEPKRGFDLAMLLVDGGRNPEAEKIMSYALDHFPYGNRGQDGARSAHNVATLLMKS